MRNKRKKFLRSERGLWHQNDLDLKSAVVVQSGACCPTLGPHFGRLSNKFLVVVLLVLLQIKLRAS